MRRLLQTRVGISLNKECVKFIVQDKVIAEDLKEVSIPLLRHDLVLHSLHGYRAVVLHLV
jgi:hypothetical protein